MLITVSRNYAQRRILKMSLKGEVGGHMLNYHGYYIDDHGKIMENHGILFLNFCGNPVFFLLYQITFKV